MSWVCPSCKEGNDASQARCLCGYEIETPSTTIESIQVGSQTQSTVLPTPQSQSQGISYNALKWWCAGAGALLFFILNIVSGGDVPGGAKGGILGCFLGHIAASVINSFRKK